MQEDANLIRCSELSALGQEAEQEIYKPACLWRLFPIALGYLPRAECVAQTDKTSCDIKTAVWACRDF